MSDEAGVALVSGTRLDLMRRNNGKAFEVNEFLYRVLKMRPLSLVWKVEHRRRGPCYDLSFELGLKKFIAISSSISLCNVIQTYPRILPGETKKNYVPMFEA